MSRAVGAAWPTTRWTPRTPRDCGRCRRACSRLDRPDAILQECGRSAVEPSLAGDRNWPGIACERLRRVAENLPFAASHGRDFRARRLGPLVAVTASGEWLLRSILNIDDGLRAANSPASPSSRDPAETCDASNSRPRSCRSCRVGRSGLSAKDPSRCATRHTRSRPSVASRFGDVCDRDAVWRRRACVVEYALKTGARCGRMPTTPQMAQPRHAVARGRIHFRAPVRWKPTPIRLATR